MSVGVVNKQTGDRIPTAGMPAIDAALSGSSTNPVQNRVVKAAFDAIKDGQSIDSFADVETALGEKADIDIVASDFSTAVSYTAGDYCIYEGKFYKFKASHSGAWSAADVDEIKIAGELSSLKSGLASKAKVCNINVPVEKTDINGFLGHILGTIIDEQEIGSYVVIGAWDTHDYYTGLVYKLASNNAIGIIHYGTDNLALYSVSYMTGQYIRYKAVQFSS